LSLPFQIPRTPTSPTAPAPDNDDLGIIPLPLYGTLSTKRAELIELEKTIRWRQKLIDLTSREIEDGILKLEEEKKAVEEKKAQAEEPANCTVAMTEPERLTTRRGEVSGLQVMGVFTL
jgi:hypothetical protein